MRLEDFDGLTQDQQFDLAAKNAGVPQQVLRNMWQAESASGQNMGPSTAGAEGHFQQMPGTRKVLEERAGRSLDPYNFQQGLFMASELMKENMQHFGSVEKAVQAYNAGWDEKRWNNDETRGYINKVLGFGGSAKPEDFNVSGEQVREGRMDAQLQMVQQQSAADVQAKLTPNQKVAIQQGISQALSSGVDMDDAVALYQSAKAQPEAVVAAATPVGVEPAQPSYTTANSVIQEQLDADKARADEADNRGYGETLEAALNEFSVTQNIWREITMTTARDTDAARVVDEAWQKHYIENRPALTKGLSPVAITQLDGARNQSEYDTIVADDKEQQRYQQVLQDSEHPILWGVVGSFLDPLSLAAGVATDGMFTAGRMAAMGGQIAKSALAKPTLAGMAYRGGIAGAATNVEITGMLQALGKKTDVNDYMHAVAAGLGLGILGGAAGYGLTKLDRQHALNLMEETHRRAAADTVDNLVRAKDAAATALGPELAELAKQQATQRTLDDINAVQSPIDNSQKPFGQNKPEPVQVSQMQDKYGFDTVTDEEALMTQAGLRLDAEQYFAERPQIMPRLTRIAEEVNIRSRFGVQSTGSILRMDNDPLARMLGVEIAEDAGGESGYRVMTAAIDSKLRLQSYINGVEHSFMSNYHDWLDHMKINQVVGQVETFLTGHAWERFMTEVSNEIRARGRASYTPSAPQSVIRAANRLENGFQAMGDDQRLNLTLGNEFIPESSIGYLPQQLNGAALNKLSLTERQRVIAEFERQAVHELEMPWDPEFAGVKVREYIKRAEDWATQVDGRGPPAPKGLKEAAMEELRADKAAGKLTEEQYLAGVERLRKGAGKHTGKRIDWDLTPLIQRDDGSLMPLSDLFVNDALELYRGYANRVAGDVALARKGILGDRDIDMITETLRASKSGNPLETVPAWQQLIAEIYNRPVSRDAHSAAGKILRPIRQFTNLRLLGGTVFPQLAETANIMTHMGVMNTLGIVQKIPRLAGELSMIKRGEIPPDSILASVDRIVGAPLGGEEWQFVLPRVFDENTGILDGYSIGTINRIIAGGQLIHQKLSFMRVATTIQKRFVGEEIVAKSLRYMRDGIEENALTDMGFSKEMAAAFRDHMDEFAKFDERGYCVAFDASRIPEQFRDDYIAALHRGVNQIIQGTFPGETGKWMRTELTQTLFQLRRFPAVAIEKQMIRQFRNLGTMRALGGISAGMGLGTLIYMGRAQIAASLMEEGDRKKYLEERLSLGAIAAGATTYVSALGMSTDVMNLFGGAAHMVNDSYNLGIWNSRGIPAQGLGSIVPSLGTVDDLYNLSQNPSIKGGLQVLPFSNLPMVLPLLNHIKSVADEDD